MSGVVTVSRALTPRNWTSTSDPTNGWDAADGVRVGDHWYNSATGNVFVCVTNTVGAAVWRHIPRILGASGAALAHTGDTTETTKATITIPANAMGVNGVIRLTASWSYTNSANAKTFRARFSGAAGAIFLQVAPTTTATGRDQRQFQNRNSASSQVYQLPAGGNATGGWGAGTGALTTTSVDTTAETTVVLTTQLASAGETATIESYMVELFRPDIT